MVLVDRETLNVSWELSCSREAHEGRENPGLADRSISDRHQKIYKKRSSTQGSLEELKRKGISKGCNDTYAPLIWLNHHLSEWLCLPGSCPAALQLVLHSTQRPSLPAWLPVVILITDTEAMEHHKQNVHDFLLQISPLILCGNFAHISPKSSQSVD